MQAGSWGAGARWGAGSPSRQNHSCLGRHLFKSHLFPRRAEAASSRGPGARRAAPTPACCLLSRYFLTDSRSREAAQRLPKTISPSWSHTLLATYCMAGREARRPPGSPLPYEAKPGQSMRPLSKSQRVGAGGRGQAWGRGLLGADEVQKGLLQSSPHLGKPRNNPGV